MNHQHILGLQWCPLSSTSLLMTTSYIDSAIKVEIAQSAYSHVSLSAHQQNANEWRFAGGPIVAPFYYAYGEFVIHLQYICEVSLQYVFSYEPPTYTAP